MFKGCRRYTLAGTTAFFLFVMYFFLPNMIPGSTDWHYDMTFDYECQKNESHSQLVHYCIQGSKIFFIETSGSSVLSVRQACAVESTAYKNPNMSISVLLTSGNGVNSSHPLMRSLMQLTNVKIQAINIDVFVHGSPLWSWFRAGKWRKSQWKVSHLSDALRFFVIWKYGGIYLDLDIVMLRSIEHLRNSVVTENWMTVAAGILIFDQGHELIYKTLIDFALNYNPYNFAANGPGVITRNIKEYCGILDISKVSGTDCNVNVLPPEAAFPIPWEEWEKYFIGQEEIKNISSHYNSSYMMHVWNKSSAFKKLKIGSHSLYEKAIKEYCPLAYDHAQKILFF